MSPVGSTRRFWETRAALLAFRLNVAAWLDRLGPVLFTVTSIGALALYALRRVRSPVQMGWVGLSAAILLAALVVGGMARRRFFSSAEARVLLESHLRLDTRLTAAAAGLVPWPAAPQSFPAIVRWQLGTVLGWTVGGVLLVLLATWMPVPAPTIFAHATEKPPSLAQTEALLAALAEAQIAETTAVEQLAERARELANRPTDEQYSHSALEAADALREQAGAAVSALGRNLEAAANALQSSATNPSAKSSTDQVSAALSGLRESALPPNADLMKQLGDGSALKNLSADQLKQLAEHVANAAQRAKGVLGAAGSGAKVAQPDPDVPSSKMGRGGPGRGGGGGGTASAPLALANAASDAGKGKVESLTATSLSNISLGDKLGSTSGAHDVDPAKAAGPTAAGAIAAPAQGGEAVWVNRLTPAERAALKDFYK